MNNTVEISRDIKIKKNKTSFKFKRRFTGRGTEYYNEWLTFYPKKDNRGFCLQFSPWSYFDPRPKIVTYVSSLLTIAGFITLGFIDVSYWWSLLLVPTLFFSWGQIFINLPFDSGNGNTAEYPDYSIDFYSVDGEFPNHIWFRLGKKSKSLHMPWAFNWFRTSMLLKDGGWEHETKGHRKEFWDNKYDSIKFVETHPYTYTLNSGEKQERTATITVIEREWRRYYTPFTKLFNMTRRVVDVEFSEEVGERSGSWKGGTIGCSYVIKKGETPLECLRRMENERKFK